MRQEAFDSDEFLHETYHEVRMTDREYFIAAGFAKSICLSAGLHMPILRGIVLIVFPLLTIPALMEEACC